MAPLRIGLLGASRIAPKAVIAPAAARDDVVVSVVAARDLGRAQAYAEAHAIPVAIEGYEALAARGDVDVIYCALPPPGHLESCLQALAAGKALLVEKPFARNAAEAARIVGAAQGGPPALEAFHYRFHPLFRRAEALVRGGAIGRVVRAQGRFDARISRAPGELRWIPEQGGGGTMDLGCYVVHALRTLLGAEPQVLSARAEVIDGVDATMETELVFDSIALLPCAAGEGDRAERGGGGEPRSEGSPRTAAAATPPSPGFAWSPPPASLGERTPVPAAIRTSMLGERLDWVELEGEVGRLRFDSFVSPQRGGRLTLTTADGVRKELAEGPGSYGHQLAHLVAVMRDGAAPLTGGRDAVANMAVLDAIRRAAGLEALL